MKRAGLLAFACLIGFPLAVPQARARPDSLADLDAFILRTMKEYQVPGAAVAVMEDGKAVLVKGYGLRDGAKRAPVDENTIFQLASVSKVFTAAAAGTLVDAGKLAWDTPIINTLPEFVDYDPYATRYLTMRDLLAMRTGWPEFTGDKLDAFGYNRREILARLRYLKPTHSLREVSSYSNPGYFLAGEVAARAAGTSWNELVEQRLLKPLGMARSGTSVKDLADPNSYTPYALVNSRVQPVAPTDQDTMGAAGAVTSTAADMARWLQLFLGRGRANGRQVLQPETVAEMYRRSMVGRITFTEVPPISEATGFYYGLGFDSYDYAGHQIIEKAGALAGVRTCMTLVPDRNAGIAVLDNLNLAPFPEAVRAYYVEKLLGRAPEADLREIAARGERITKLFAATPPPPNPGKFNGSLRDLVGVYANDYYGRCAISLVGGRLQAEFGPARYRAELKHWRHGQFHLEWPGATDTPDNVTFTIGAEGTADNFTDEALGLFTRVAGKGD
jgi:CubicO group peptidase (beta-lactamase class C family)